MSNNPTLLEKKALEMVTVRANLEARNKEQARIQLLRIQLLLAQRPIPEKR